MNIRRLVIAIGSAALLVSAIAAPTMAVASLAPAPTGGVFERIVDDDGAAGLTDQGQPDCFSGNTAAPFYTTISAAVAASAAGDDIFVCPGFYNESVTISTTVHVYGPYMGMSAFGCPFRSGQATVTAASGFAFNLNADNIVVDGLRFAGSPGGGMATSSTFSGYQVWDNVFTNNGGAGLGLASANASTNNVEENCFSDNNNGGKGDGIKQTTAGLYNTTINHDTFKKHRSVAIELDGTAGGITGINITNNLSRNDVSFASLKTVGNVLVDSNDIGSKDLLYGISVAGTAIKIFGAASNVDATNNKIHANYANGIEVNDTASGSDLTSNKITLVDNGISVASSTAAAANVTWNVVKNITNTGLKAGASTTGLTFDNNKVGFSNTACQDLSTGAGTAGTANTWTNNHRKAFAPDVPLGICNHP